MSRIRTPWTPPNTDDTANEHVLGFDWSADIAVTANGLWWLQAGVNKPSSVRAMMWLTSGPTLVADSGTVSTSGWTLDTWNLVPFTSGFSASPSTTYTIGVYLVGAYKYSSTDLGSDQVDGSGHVRALAHTGRFLNAGGANFPTSTWDGMFGTDLDFTPGGATVTGTASAVLGSLTAAATGKRTVFGSVVAALGRLTADVVVGSTKAESAATVAAGSTSSATAAAPTASTPTVTRR